MHELCETMITGQSQGTGPRPVDGASGSPGAPRGSRAGLRAGVGGPEGRSGGPPEPARSLSGGSRPGLPAPAARHIWFHSGPPPPPGALLLSSPLPHPRASRKAETIFKNPVTHTQASGAKMGGEKGGKSREARSSRPAAEVGQVGSALPGRAAVASPGRPRCRPPRSRTQRSR
jgi:hypothetical protein